MSTYFQQMPPYSSRKIAQTHHVISFPAPKRQGIVSIADIFRAKVVDVSKDSLIVEMTGSKTKLEAFIDLMGDYEILELARAGVMGP